MDVYTNYADVKTIVEPLTLTTTYQKSEIVYVGSNQSSLLVNFIKDLNDLKMIIEFSPDGIMFFSETDNNEANHQQVIHTFQNKGKFCLPIDVYVRYLRVLVKSTGDATDTVTINCMYSAVEQE